MNPSGKNPKVGDQYQNKNTKVIYTVEYVSKDHVYIRYMKEIKQVYIRYMKEIKHVPMMCWKDNFIKVKKSPLKREERMEAAMKEAINILWNDNTQPMRIITILEEALKK